MKWLFLVHQVQTTQSRERVKVWRLTKKIGAQLYRNSVYVLPYNKERLEDFQWLCEQIRGSKGEASVFISESDSISEDKVIVNLFQDARKSEYSSLMKSVAALQNKAETVRNVAVTSGFLKDTSKELRALTTELSEIQKRDFFSHPLSDKARESVMRVQKSLSAFTLPSATARFPEARSTKAYRGRLWGTREHIHIDRTCSCWLIRRFIDPKARFIFVSESRLPKNAIPFDVVGAEFSHHGDLCTFETLVRVFGLKDKALGTIAELVHDIDLKDQKFGRSEAAGLDLLVRSISGSEKDDNKVLEIWFPILDSLYKRFAAVSVSSSF